MDLLLLVAECSLTAINSLTNINTIWSHLCVETKHKTNEQTQKQSHKHREHSDGCQRDGIGGCVK